MYLKFTVRCTDTLKHSKQCLMKESIITDYSFAISSLALMHKVVVYSLENNTSDLDPPTHDIALLLAKFLEWVQDLKSMFENWKSISTNGEIMFVDALTLQQQPKYTCSSSLYDVEISDGLVKNVLEEFRHQFEILAEILLPVVSLQHSEIRLVHYSLLYEAI